MEAREAGFGGPCDEEWTFGDGVKYARVFRAAEHAPNVGTECGYVSLGSWI